ncbi:hypothetical protein [uncultured Leifsonia sp.]|uniref:hypothetical protein n=1 Tax=uncultured Leifsonia sp. TaxID=340359 RepID=UPI0025E78189|nr:hypothetical protein [uncultured Leifsonia sp.]
MDDGACLPLRSSYDLAGVTGRETYLDAMVEALGVIVPVDSTGWGGLDLPRGASSRRRSDRRHIPVVSVPPFTRA